MAIIQLDNKQRRIKLFKIILWVLFPFFLLIPLFNAIFTDELGGTGILSVIIGIIGLFIIITISDNYYKWPLVLFTIFFIGLLFKSQHWPGAGPLLTMSTLVLSLVSIVIILRFLFKSHQNQFIRWFGILTGLVTTSFMCGWVIMILRWSHKVGTILGYIGSLTFLISILAMVFTLPNSNYIGWSAQERKIFFRVIMIPMLFLFVIITLNMVFLDAFLTLLGFYDVRWYFNGIELINLEGIPIL
jgi:hypothetical protein